MRVATAKAVELIGGGFPPVEEPIKKGKKRTACPPHLKPSIRRMHWRDLNEGKCFSCGRILHYDDADVGHIQASSKGGEWSPDNCRLICRKCNSGMQTTNMKKYMKKYYPKEYAKHFKSDVLDKTTKNTPVAKKTIKKKSASKTKKITNKKR